MKKMILEDLEIDYESDTVAGHRYGTVLFADGLQVSFALVSESPGAAARLATVVWHDRIDFEKRYGLDTALIEHYILTDSLKQ